MSMNAIHIFEWIKAPYSESFDFDIFVSIALVYLGHICRCILFSYVANSSNCKHKIEWEKKACFVSSRNILWVIYTHTLKFACEHVSCDFVYGWWSVLTLIAAMNSKLFDVGKRVCTVWQL